MKVFWLLLVILMLSMVHPGLPTAAAAEGGSLEELRYRLDLGVWTDVAQVRLRLSQVGPGHFRAEFGGAAQGAWSLLSRWMPERYETEMSLESGELRPLVYRERFRSKGHDVQKEYRFDSARGILEVWRGVDGREPVKSWQVPLTGPVYDSLSLFYNLRLGVFGSLPPGSTLKVAALPTPEPREMIFRIGPDTPEGRKVMLEVVSPQAGEDQADSYFIFCTPQLVPQQAWVRVLAFGKLSGQLLNPEAVRQEGLPALLRLSLNGRSPKIKN